MRPPVFIGDRISAAGFRLGGAEVNTPEPGMEATVFRAALEDSELVLLTAEVANRLPDTMLDEAMISEAPLVLVIPDVRGLHEPVDIADSLRRQLGMAE
ncbi:MAG: Vacuolar H+transporting two-sector ATPase F subunit [Gammaproteobacteria bacterium]|nr:Vacuolar H+transporting two-sector ATPase F subunit [Gammaproteobacteria bacterium]